MLESSPTPENLHLISEEKRVLREARAGNDAIPLIRETAEEGLAEIKASLVGLIAAGGGITALKERIRHDRETAETTLNTGVDHEAVLRSLGEKGDAYETITNAVEESERLRDFTITKMREVKDDPIAMHANERLLLAATKEQERLEQTRETLTREHPNEARAFELIRDKEGLAQEGHIAPTASVTANLDRIGRNMLVGKPMFLHGPTGTGKTSLARYAAHHFTGKSAEMVYCNPQTRESAIWGKTGIRETPSGAIETVDIFGPLAKAMQEGKVVIFDEFTALPKEQMVFIKGVMNAKQGDEINIPGNGQILIAQGFQIICTANLKSAKNPERQELPPEIAREFEQNNIKIDYQPKDESYDIMLARLMNPDGSIDASWRTLNATLPKLCEAMEEIQTAYTGTTPKDVATLAGAMDASGKTQGLKKLVLTQGTVEAMCDAWKAGKLLGDTATFEEHIDQRLKITLTFEDYPLADRILAAKILASKGFLSTLTPDALGLPADVFKATVRPKDEREGGENRAHEKETNIPLIELAALDPFGARQSSVKAKAAGILDALKAGTPALEEDARDLDPEHVKATNEPFLKESFEKWYGAQVVQPEQVPIIISPKDQDFAELAKETGDQAKAKFGEYTVNPEMFNLDWENIPPEKIKILDLSAFKGKPLHEVAQHIVDTYGDTHYIPGIEFWKWIIEEYDNASLDVKEKYKSLADGKYYFNFGSLVRDSDGRWGVPSVDRVVGGGDRRANWLGRGWYGDYRVVLLEK